MGTEKKTQVLLVGDLHETTDAVINEVASVAAKEKLTVLNLGDYIDRRGADDTSHLAERMKHQMAPFENSGEKVITIQGNHDPKLAYNRALDGLKNTKDNHNTITELDQYSIVGFGGMHAQNALTDHGGSYYKEESMAKQVKTLVRKCCEPHEEQYVMLQLHEPPKGHFDKVASGYRVGNEKFRELIDNTNIGVVAAAHVHECPGVQIRVRRKNKREKDDGFNGEEKRYLRYWDVVTGAEKYPTYDFVPKDKETGKPSEDYKKYFGPIPGIKITDEGILKRGGYGTIDNSKKLTLTYNMDSYDLTLFVNPGSLCDNELDPFTGRYAVMKLSEKQMKDGKYRTIELEMRKVAKA